MRFSDIDRNPSRRTLQHFAMLSLLVLGAMGGARLIHTRSSAAGWSLVALALVLAALGACCPRALKPIFVGWLTITFPIGWLVSHLILALLYFGAITPLSILFRFRGRDALRLKQPTAESYWTERPQPADPGQYLKQF